ncbi:MAG: cell division protein FtsZ [bacterium]|nr:cell division protein FtsZ [bacterium]
MFIPVQESIQPARIKVVGVGGAGGNAINRMISYGFSGVDFISINTDQQILSVSKAPVKIQIGKNISRGLGGGGNPDVGKKSAEESKDEIREAIEGADMLFITAGMGGATGTGASPIVAEIAKELGILTIAIVTKPFEFEGKKRINSASNGIISLKEAVDTMLVIPNEKLKNISDKTTPLNQLFEAADNVLYHAAKGISDIIIRPGFVNRDFADVRSVMTCRGDAVIGVGSAKGDDKGASAAQIALDCPILEDSSIEGASAMLVTLTGPSNMAYGDIEDAMAIIRKRAGENTDINWGASFDDALDNEIRITIVATGIERDKQNSQPQHKAETLELFENSAKKESKKKEEILSALDVKRTLVQDNDIEKPAYIRRASD